MARYKVDVIIETNSDYTNGNQIEDIQKEISMVVADYNCFLRISDVTVEKLK